MNIIFAFLSFFCCSCFGQQLSLFKVGFYNVENLFDAEDHPDFWDEAYTPDGHYGWTKNHVHQKIGQLVSVIEALNKTAGGPLILLGICEVENLSLVQQICSHPKLQKFGYSYSHYESKDARGIDVALLYQKQHFRLTYSQKYPLKLIDSKKQIPYYSRDQLWIGGYFKGEFWHIGVNHWPSRRGGEKRSRGLRQKAAYLQRKVIDSLQNLNPSSRILSMGDFNDNPSDKSVQFLTRVEDTSRNSSPLINPMRPLESPHQGSLAYRDRWFLFDQILYSSSFLKSNGGSFWYRAQVFKPSWLVTAEGRYRGYPFRTHREGKLLEGFSDHFPVVLLGAIPYTSNSTSSSGYKK